MGKLEYGGFILSGNDEDVCIDLSEGWQMPVQVRGRDWIVPKLDGRIYGNRRADTLLLPLAGFIRGSNGSTPQERLEDFNTNAMIVSSVLDPTLDPQTLELSEGYLGLLAGVVVTIEARVKNVALGRIQSYRNVPFQLLTAELEALNPAWEYGS
jgi:hypothetical protein